MDAAKERTVTRSFRIKESAFSALQQEADKRNISVNTLLNLLLSSFSEYDRFLEEFHMIKLSNPTFRKILQACDESSIREAGKKAGATLPKSFILAKRGEVTREAVAEYMKMMSQYANLFEFNMTRHAGGTSITLVHELGAKGSAFFGEYAKAAFEVSGVADEIEFDENSVTITLKERIPITGDRVRD